MTSDCIINHWLLDIASASLIHKESGEQRRLGEYQLKLLVVLIQHAGQILSREELNQLVWERRVIGNNSLPNAIHALRVALEDDGRQQRIIKTVPKKGYILESEFCQFQPRINDEMHEIDEIEKPRDVQLLRFSPPPIVVQPAIENEETVVADSENAAPTISPKKTEDANWFKPFLAILAVLIALAVMVYHSASLQKPRFVVHPIEGLEQIRVLQLTNTPRDISTAQLDMSRLLGTSLRELETPLKQRLVRMDVYYSAAGPTLNLTLNLQSQCAHQQLAMTIFNASDSPAELGELMKVETERKLHEMATCNP